MEKVIIGSDKSGFLLKETVKTYLIENGYDVDDFGTLDEEKPLPFFEVAETVSKKIQQGEAEKAVLVCGTGMGMSIVANKHKGITAAACESTYAAEKCRAINDANILCMGGWIIAPILGVEMVRTFMNTSFTQSLEEWRAKNLEKARTMVKNIERTNFK